MVCVLGGLLVIIIVAVLIMCIINNKKQDRVVRLRHPRRGQDQGKGVQHYANTPMQYTTIFHGCKNVHFQMIQTEAVLTSTHNLCFGAKINKRLYPCKPQFFYIKVGCKGVFVTGTCFRADVFLLSTFLTVCIDLK